MSWDFSTEPEFEDQLRWMRTFVDHHILPLETLTAQWRGREGRARYAQVVAPLKAEVKKRGLWAAHLPPELGGGGMGQVALGLIHEILGRSSLAPAIFGNNAPDSGNAELLALGGNEEQKRVWLRPLLAGEVASCFAMTEPGAGSDPTRLQTSADASPDGWVINGRKWFISNAAIADFHIVMCRSATDPDTPPREAFSMFVVPSETPGVILVRDIPTMAEPDLREGDVGAFSEVQYEQVRVPHDHLVGRIGQGFDLAQARLGPGRIHHAMRWLGQSRRAFDMLCERAVSRVTGGARLADRQLVQEWVAESWAAMEASRLLTLQAAWRMDQLHAAGRPYTDARVDIGLIKFWGGRVLYDVIDRAIQVHGSLGYSADLPLELMYRRARASRLYDGPDEVHKITVGRTILKDYAAAEVPTEHIPTRRAAAERTFTDLLDQAALNA